MALYVVTGPPAAGKSTWVLGRATSQDVVVDYDRLACALTGTGVEGHDHAPAVQAVTKVARRAAIDQAVRWADRVDVYVIHSTPSETTMARYRRLGAQIVVIDPGRAVTLERCARERPRRMRTVATEWYDKRVTESVPVTSRQW